MILLLIACAAVPEPAELERAGYAVREVAPDSADRVGTDRVTGLRDIRCWDATRPGGAGARVCSYRFDDWSAAMSGHSFGLHPPGYPTWSMIRGSRVLVARSADLGVGRDVFAIVAEGGD